MSVFDFLFGGADATNDKLVKDQQKSALQARLDEEARQKRISEGMSKINTIFDGTPNITGYTPGTSSWQTLLPANNSYYADLASNISGIGEAYAPFKSYDPTQKINEWISFSTPSALTKLGLTLGYGSYNPPGPKTKADGVYVKDASGNTVFQGSLDQLKGWQGNVATKTPQYGTPTGGFGEDFYNDYKQGYLGFFNPQVDDQYEDVKDEATYAFGRAGTLRSSMAADKAADLSRQYEINRAQIANQADTAVGGLRDKVNATKQAAISQLMSTEDPSAAASYATNAAVGLRNEQPAYSPLADLFTLGTIGAAGYNQGRIYRNAMNVMSPFSSSGRNS